MLACITGLYFGFFFIFQLVVIMYSYAYLCKDLLREYNDVGAKE